MEKISIARRRLEKKKSAVIVKKPDDLPEGSIHPPQGQDFPLHGPHVPRQDAGGAPQGPDFPLQGSDFPAQNLNFPPQDLNTPPPEQDSLPQGTSSEPQGMSFPQQDDKTQPPQVDLSNIQSPPAFSLDSLISLINEEGGLLELGKKQFTLEIVSGVEKPVRMLVSIQPVNEKTNSPQTEQGYVSPEEAAQTLKVSKNTIYKQLKEGSLKGLKVGCRWRVRLNPANEAQGSERGNE